MVKKNRTKKAPMRQKMKRPHRTMSTAMSHARRVNEAGEDDQERFDAKLPASQKRYFEKAVTLGAYRSLSDFVFKAAQEKADEIITQHENLLASDLDREVFFNAMMNPPAPNTKLSSAMQEYLAAINRS